MPEEPESEVLAPTQARKSPIHLSADGREAFSDRMAEMLLDVPMTSFLRVHVRRIGREPFHLDLGMCGGIRLHSGSPMGAQPVPDDDHRSSDVSRQMLPHHQDILRAEGVLKMALVDLAGEREPANGGELAALTQTPQDGRLADWRPCGGHLGAKGKPGFVHKDYVSSFTASFFLIRGQSWVSQACTRASSRSRA